MKHSGKSQERNHHRKEKFLEICLLVLLGGEAAHGYRLLEQLGQFGYASEDVDVGALYRTLRRMEENDLVLSEWEDSDQGPNRRKYFITPEGHRALETRIEHMKHRIEYMNRVLEYHEQQKQRSTP